MRDEAKVAIVTGASRGIGKQIAIRLARNGINLVLAARTLEAGKSRWPGSLEETAAQARTLGVEADCIKCDVTVRSEVEELCKAALEKHHRVDILVNNALYLGPGNYNPFLETAFETWDRNMEANLMAAVVASRVCLPAMLGQRQRGDSQPDLGGGHDERQHAGRARDRRALRGIESGAQSVRGRASAGNARFGYRRIPARSGHGDDRARRSGNPQGEASEYRRAAVDGDPGRGGRIPMLLLPA